MSAMNFKPKWDTRRPRTLIIVTDAEWGISIDERHYLLNQNGWETAHVLFEEKYKDIRRLSDSITLVITKEKK
jgi:hypothetical protein